MSVVLSSNGDHMWFIPPGIMWILSSPTKLRLSHHSLLSNPLLCLALLFRGKKMLIKIGNPPHPPAPWQLYSLVCLWSPSSGIGTCPRLFCLILGTHSSYWVCLALPWCGGGAWFHLNLMCHASWTPTGGLPLSGDRGRVGRERG